MTPNRSTLEKLVNVSPDELGSTLAAIGYFFCVLFGYSLIRPVREALGVQRNWEDLYWLFGATALAMLLVNPVYALLVARLRRHVLVPVVYAFFLSNLLGFYALLTVAPDVVGLATGYTFYVWLSVFNLFATSIFWQVMVDSFSLEQSKRIFPMIAVGGTMGAIAGSTFTWQLVERIGAVNMLPLAAGVIAVGVALALVFMRLAPSRTPDHVARRVPSMADAVTGVALAARSPYLFGICAYIFALAIAATFLYFAQVQIVAGAAAETDARAKLFASIYVATQWTTLILQLFVVGRLMRRVGVGVTLTVLPALAMGLVASVAIWPTVLGVTIAQSAFNAVKYAVARPARETLFTVLSRDEKYAAKGLLDTFVYRSGDLAGAGVRAGISKAVSAAIIPAAMALSVVAGVMGVLGLGWIALGLWLGVRQRRLAEAQDAESQSPQGATSGA